MPVVSRPDDLDRQVGDLDLVSAKWGPSFGAFQIRHLKTGPQPSIDPFVNSRDAFAKWQVQGWNAWGAHLRSADRQWLPAAHRAVADYLAGA